MFVVVKKHTRNRERTHTRMHACTHERTQRKRKETATQGKGRSLPRSAFDHSQRECKRASGGQAHVNCTAPCVGGTQVYMILLKTKRKTFAALAVNIKVVTKPIISTKSITKCKFIVESGCCSCCGRCFCCCCCDTALVVLLYMLPATENKQANKQISRENKHYPMYYTNQQQGLDRIF